LPTEPLKRQQYLSDVLRVQDDYNGITRGLRKEKINNQGDYMLALNDTNDLQLSYKGKQTYFSNETRLRAGLNRIIGGVGDHGEEVLEIINKIK
jgi:hypothetical protein